jgi:Flp pilus assembly protein TadD
LIAASRRGLLVDPNDWSQHDLLGVGYEGTGKLPDAISEYQKAIELSDGDPNATVSLAHAYSAVGKRAEAEKILRDLERKSKGAYLSPYTLATVYAGLGNNDRAFELLDKAYSERSFDLSSPLEADLRLDNLRPDPRFQHLLRRIGLTSP